MPAFVLLIILFGFPLLELFVLIWAAHYIGWWLLLVLVASAVAGWALIQEERFAVLGRVMTSTREGSSPLGALLISGRMVLAGVLLIFPGLVSDLLALLVLLLPGRAFGRRQQPDAARPGVYDGEWRQVDPRVDPRDGAGRTLEGSYRREDDPTGS